MPHNLGREMVGAFHMIGHKVVAAVVVVEEACRNFGNSSVEEVVQQPAQLAQEEGSAIYILLMVHGTVVGGTGTISIVFDIIKNCNRIFSRDANILIEFCFAL